MLHVLLFLLAFSSTAKSNMEAFIVGGRYASMKSWPFITFIEVAHKVETMMVSACGGSLLSSQTVLTAAHCLDDVTLSKRLMKMYRFTVYMGHSTFNKSTMARQVKDYETPIMYDPARDDVRADIGVMFLYNPVKFGPNIGKVILFNRKFSLKRDKKLIVAGWGKTSEDSNHIISPKLKEVEVNSISGKRCRKQVPLIDTRAVVCVKNSKKGHAYSGDSGGPLVKLNSRYQVGVVSFRHEDSGVTVYTNVYYFYSWIKRVQLKLYKKHCKKRIN